MGYLLTDLTGLFLRNTRLGLVTYYPDMDVKAKY